MLDAAFNQMIRLHSRVVTLRRYTASTSTTCTIRIAPSNFFRNLEGPSHTTVEEKEFVIPLAQITGPFSPVLKIGDKIEDTQLGNMAITYIQEMYDLGAVLMGFRIRCQ